MTEINLTKSQIQRIEYIYEELEAAYDGVAKQLDFTCKGCSDNCCDSYFMHHTYVEWAYLHLGFSKLPEERQKQVYDRCKEYVKSCKEAKEKDERPQVMCPLNDDGLCSLYHNRLLVCRTHGVPAIMRFPNGQARHFMGCFRCQEIIEERYARNDHAPHVERTPHLAKLIAIENELCNGDRDSLPKIKMTIAEMIVAGAPNI
ncbi:MAG: hypothetical protein OCC45_01430 [Desulfotalea sp.]